MVDKDYFSANNEGGRTHPSRREGWVYEVQHYAIHDGPGVRTLVFFKGCPLRCLWCSNPESQEPFPEMSFSRNKCIGCGNCISACPRGAIYVDKKNGLMQTDRNLCRDCDLLPSGSFPCCEVCPAGARTTIGRLMSVEEILKEIERDRPIYKRTNGGVTISGGEPLEQPEFLVELVKALKEKWFSVALETSGYGSWEILRTVLPFLDFLFLDIKAFDSILHEQYTGKSNGIILENARKLALWSRGKTHGKAFQVIYRVPLVQGLTCREDVVIPIFEFIRKELGGGKVEFMLYHRLGRGKYEPLGREYVLKELEPLSSEAEEVKRLKTLALHVGLEVVTF